MSGETNSLGNIFVSHRAIATIAYQAAISSYGVVGLAPKSIVEGIANALVKDPSLGVEIRFVGSDVYIDLYIIIEYGTRVKSVAATVANQVRYQVEKTVGIPVNEVNVHVRGLRISDTD